MERKEAVKFAVQLKKFMDMKIEDFDKNGESFKFKDNAHRQTLEPFIEALHALNKAFPDLDNKVCEYSMAYDMEYLISVKRFKFILETTIKNNCNFGEINVTRI